MDAGILERALRLLGDVLSDRGLSYELVTIGGGSLLLTEVIVRPTADLDVLARVVDDALVSAEPLPGPLREAAAVVADVVGIAPDWLDSRPTQQLRHGLPEGFLARTIRRTYGPLALRLAGRFDQICLKLYAAADHGPRSKHVADLIALAADPDELEGAAVWVRGQDLSDVFREHVDAVIQHVARAR